MKTPLLNQELIAKMAMYKLLGQNSCQRCAYSYMQDTGYSNWTVTGTDFICAQDRNPNLPAEIPYDMHLHSDGQDPWDKTREGRCELFEELAKEQDYIHLDVEGEDSRVPDDYPAEPLRVITEHCGRKL